MRLQGDCWFHIWSATMSRVQRVDPRTPLTRWTLRWPGPQPWARVAPAEPSKSDPGHMTYGLWP